MNSRLLSRLLLCITIVVLLQVELAFSTDIGAPAKTRAGAWKATTDCGDFTLFVSHDGTAIINANYTIKKPAVGSIGQDSKTKPWANPFPIDGDKLSLSITKAGIPFVEWKATFSRDGKQLSGTVHFMPTETKGGCKAKFSIRR